MFSMSQPTCRNEIIKKPRAKRRLGIGEAADFLGVNRDHLRRVLQGKYKNPELLARYHALKTSQASQGREDVKVTERGNHQTAIVSIGIR